MNKMISKGLIPISSSKTKTIAIHGSNIITDDPDLAVYGRDAEKIQELQKDKCLSEKLVAGMPYTKAEVVWCIRNEMARTVEDVLARRLRILFLNARSAMEAAPGVTEILKNELNQKEEWKQNQLANFLKLAKEYLP
jgi:glycerol-3-phosphate dehydrogenase